MVRLKAESKQERDLRPDFKIVKFINKSQDYVLDPSALKYSESKKVSLFLSGIFKRKVTKLGS